LYDVPGTDKLIRSIFFTIRVTDQASLFLWPIRYCLLEDKQGLGMDDKQLKILLIDDDEDDLVLLREILKDIRGKEYQVDWAHSYQEARSMLERDSWDIIFVDYDLGLHNGLDLIREAVEKGIKTPMVMITGRGRYELDVEAMNSGAVDYLSKNMINPAFLERVIRYSIERSRSKEILEETVARRTAELQNALEELRVVEEELRTEHEELAQSILLQENEIELHDRTFAVFSVVELITDKNGVIIETNNEAAKVFQCETEALKGKLLSFYVTLQERRQFVHLLSQLSETVASRTQNFPLSINSKDAGDWCVTVVPMKKGLAQTGEYYWLLHPVVAK
jgi:DNA-binding response OmpR family regulator